MTACISRTLMCHDLWDADHFSCVEREPNWAPQPELDASMKRVISISLVARGRPCRTAGDAHQAPLTEPTKELWSSRSSSLSSGTMLWRPTTGPEEDGSLPHCTSEAINSSMPSNLCRSQAVMFRLVIQCWWTDWTLRRIFGRGATVNCLSVELHPDELEVLTWNEVWLLIVYDPAITGARWWLSGHAVAPVWEYLHRSASRLSRRAASHLAALTALRPGVTAWWTSKVVLSIRRLDKWNGRLACWPQNTDTFLRPCASGHGDMHHEYPPDEDLLSFSEPGTAGCSTRGKSRRWPALRPPFNSKASTACWRFWRLILVRNLMHWRVSWGLRRKMMPTPSSTVLVARQVRSRLLHCGAKSARRASNAVQLRNLKEPSKPFCVAEGRVDGELLCWRQHERAAAETRLAAHWGKQAIPVDQTRNT